MASLLIAVIYLSYMSLGLPDSLLGSAWPIMRGDLSVPTSYMGIITMIIFGGTIVSSLMSDRLIRRVGSFNVTAYSTALTAIAMFGFSVARDIPTLFILSVPYGLGAGAIDAALNNYVATNLSSKHMNWTQAAWGAGVIISPYIMGYALSADLGWRSGYGIVTVLQVILTVMIFVSFPMWKKQAGESNDIHGSKPLKIKQIVKIKGVMYSAMALFAYCAFEQAAGIWATSYLVDFKHVDPETAARYCALYFIGMTVGRILVGFVADLIGDKLLIRYGIIVIIIGVVTIALPTDSALPSLIGLIVAGVGSAPIYPCIIHSTPSNFGKENSQSLIGFQMATAYFGNTFMPTIFGFVAQYTGIGFYPFFIGIFAILMLVTTEILNKLIAGKDLDKSFVK